MRKAFSIILTVLLAGVALYTAAGFLLAPYLVERRIAGALQTADGLGVEIGRVSVDPFKFAVTLTNVNVIRPENPLLVSVGEIAARLDPRATIAMQHGWVLRDTLRLNDVRLGAKRDTLLSASAIVAEDVTIDWREATARLGRMRVDRAKIDLYRNKDAVIALPAWIDRLLFRPDRSAIATTGIDLPAATLHLTDATTTKPVTLTLPILTARLDRRRPDSLSTLTVTGRLADAGELTAYARWRHASAARPDELRLVIDGLDLTAVSPYVEATWSRGVEAGSANIALSLRTGADGTAIESRVVTSGLRLSEPVGAATPPAASIDMAVALLRDPRDTIAVVTTGRTIATGTHFAPAHWLLTVLGDYAAQRAASPFETIEELTGRPAESFRQLQFLPGSTVIDPAGATTLAALADALRRRPLLGLRVRPGFDPGTDRNALARRQVRLHVALATSAGPPGLRDDAPLDFSDGKVRSVLDEFALTRLDAPSRASIERRHDREESKFYRAVFAALVANEAVSANALERLARYRAQSVIGELARNGVDRQRLILTSGQGEAADLRANVTLTIAVADAEQ